MLARPPAPRWLSLALVLAACGDSGGGTAGASTTTSTSTTTTMTESSSAPGTSSSTGEPTTSAGSQTAATTSDTSDTGTTAAPGTTTTEGASEGATAATSDATTEQSTSTTGGAVCGDGVVGPGESCDDGSGVGCDTYHDGGDGVCVAQGTCSDGHVLAGEDCVPELWVDHVHIHVDNTCKMTVEPSSFTVQPGQKLRLDYHNHSADYPVDVWMHYNGGYTDLQPGGTWSEKYEHCFGPNPSEGWAEISTACSQVLLPIHCL